MPSDEDFQKWETEDEMENLRLAFERITRLSKSSQSIILAAASQAYKEDKISGTLAEGYEVTVRPLPDSHKQKKKGKKRAVKNGICYVCCYAHCYMRCDGMTGLNTKTPYKDIFVHTKHLFYELLGGSG